MSNNEYEQQRFWEDNPNITPGISGTTFKLKIDKDWFNTSYMSSKAIIISNPQKDNLIPEYYYKINILENEK